MEIKNRKQLFFFSTYLSKVTLWKNSQVWQKFATFKHFSIALLVHLLHISIGMVKYGADYLAEEDVIPYGRVLDPSLLRKIGSVPTPDNLAPALLEFPKESRQQGRFARANTAYDGRKLP